MSGGDERLAGELATQTLGQHLGTEGRQAVVQGATGIRGGDRRASLQQHRARVEAGFHLHQIDSALCITGENRALDGCGTPPAWQQTGVYVPATEPGHRQHLAWQDQSIGDDHQQVGLIRRQRLLHRAGLQRFRLFHRDAGIERCLFHRAGSQFSPTAGGSIGLGIDRHHIGAAGAAGFETGHRKLGGAGENQTKPAAIQALAACLRCLSSRFSSRARLSDDR